MLDDVTVGPFLEQPARKNAPPFVVLDATHIKLHEGSGFGNILPRRGHFACTQAHDGIANAQRLSGLHGQIAGQAVAFIEQPDDCHAVFHRRAHFGSGFDSSTGPV
jgi:hypothetical protein